MQLGKAKRWGGASYHSSTEVDLTLFETIIIAHSTLHIYYICGFIYLYIYIYICGCVCVCIVQKVIIKVLFAEMYVNVVFVIRCLYSAVSLTLIKE